MAGTDVLDAIELQRLAYAAESAVRIRQAHHFHLWARGPLQGFITHRALLCLWGSSRGASHRALVCADEPMAERANLHALDILERHWRTQDGQPCILSAEGDSPAALALRRIDAGNALLHGVPDRAGAAPALFVFLDVTPAPGARQCRFAELLLPYLYVALLQTGPRADAQGEPTRSRLSPREAEVLACVRQGKTNHEIGQILDISPLTVKNHVQKILRKLNVASRREAAARGPVAAGTDLGAGTSGIPLG
ncbi:MAG: helix-turn-helix transcriptional regulator [Rhodocyclaceae bacterium]